MLKGDETFRMAAIGRTVHSSLGQLYFTMNGGGQNGRTVNPQEFRWFNTAESSSTPTSSWRSGRFLDLAQREFYLAEPFEDAPSRQAYGIRKLPIPESGPAFDEAQEFLARLLLTAQSLFDLKRLDDAEYLLDRVKSLAALNPGVDSWQEVVTESMATREMLEHQLLDSDLVPELTHSVYAGVANSFVPALETFAGEFARFVDRANNSQTRTQAASLMLNQETNALRFQALVTEQLEENLEAAEANLVRAEAAMEAQTRRVEEAEKVFQAGLEAWQNAQRRQAQLAIAGAVFSAVVGLAKVVAGKPTDFTSIAAKAASVGKIAVKIVEIAKKLEKIVKAVAVLVEMVQKIRPAVARRNSAASLAADMAAVRREADASDLNGAPSESAYWDQFWEQVELAFADPIREGVRGAREYQHQIRVMIIYGRALTSAQVAIMPIAQELAQSMLLTKLAEEQSEAIEKQLETLRKGTASSMLAVYMWLRHRAVRRAMFAALKDFYAAHRYWALRVDRNALELRGDRKALEPNGSITDLGADLIEVAELQATSAQSLAGFRPPPQNFRRILEVPADAVADFLREGRFAIRITPGSDLVRTWGRIGRVRVNEIRVWVVWHEGKAPNSMEFIIRTDDNYYDQRLVQGELREFHFIGPEVHRKFVYSPAIEARSDREKAIDVRAKVADEFLGLYSEPTLFTEWQFSLPKTRPDRTIDPKAIEALQGAVKGIEVQFFGSFIMDAGRR
jgi:hypothetical protein